VDLYSKKKDKKEKLRYIRILMNKQKQNLQMFLSKNIFPTPLGNLTGIASSKGLVLLSFEEDLAYVYTRITKYFPAYRLNNQFSKTLEQTHIWLQQYFSNAAFKTQPPAIDLHGTPFAIQAWQALLQIPAGTTRSYGDLAKSIGFPKACRAIGRIMGENPIAIIVPCHRVIGASGKLTGYRSGLKRKEWLLNHEQATILR
jgi:O-6-methylguanine DNA methyltransferase